MTSAPDTVQQAPSSSTNRAAPPSTSTSSAAVPAPAQAPTKPTSRYIETSAKNIIAREAIISGSHFIVLGGKCLIHGGAILRADLRRVGEGSVVRPPYKIYQGIFSYYPTKLGDHVTVGPNTVLEAQTVGNYVDIGANCVIGRFVNIKDCARILDGTVLAPNTVVPSLTIWAGSPGKQVAELHESFQDECETRNRRNLREFSRALRAGEPGT
ncbi:unnamed protein product [Tilletia caries]|nr:unnamed protein product [Tilletia caries]